MLRVHHRTREWPYTTLCPRHAFRIRNFCTTVLRRGKLIEGLRPRFLASHSGLLTVKVYFRAQGVLNAYIHSRY